MTVQARPAARPGLVRTGRAGPGLAGTGALTRLAFRRDRIMLPAWVYLITVLVATTAYTFKKLYPTAAARAQLAVTGGGNPALRFLYGRLNGSSIGALTAWRYGIWAAIFGALMTIFIVIRHTRGDEEAGRLELVGSAAVGRQAALTAGLLTAVTANLAISVLLCLALPASGLPVSGSVALALAIGASGLAFTGIAAVAAQLASGARGARGLAFGVLGAAFVIRAIGDSAGASGPSWLSWASPLGWVELTQPFAGPRWWVLALPLAVLALGTAGAFALAAGATWARGCCRTGPGGRPPPAGCAGRPAWPGGCSAARSAAGSPGSCASSPPPARPPRGSARYSAAAPSSGRSSPGSAARPPSPTPTWPRSCCWRAWAPRATPPRRCSGCARRRPAAWPSRCSRRRSAGSGGDSATWPWRSSVAAVLLAAAGLAAGLGYGLRAGSAGSQAARMLGAAMAQLPASLVIAGVAVALVGLWPGASVAGAWTALGAVVVVDLFGQALQLSHWVLDISPFTHAPRLPGGTVSAAPLLWLCLAAFALSAVGLAALRRRDVS